MHAIAVILQEPQRVEVSPVALAPAGDDDIVVDIAWSGVSAGTERLLWQGRMPPFPGMGYPLVPGYESVGRIVGAGCNVKLHVGDQVFVPGARCFGGLKGLFGGAASRLVTPASRAIPVDEAWGDKAILLALAATAWHAMSAPNATPPDLIVGHGALGRLLARLTILSGAAPPTVWEREPARAMPEDAYQVTCAEDDARRDYRAIYDVSGDGSLLDALIGRLAPGGEITLAGFYSAPLSFSFPPAFMREARLRAAAEWRASDLASVRRFIDEGRLSLDGLVTHRRDARDAADAYRVAFEDPSCLKMVLDWRTCS
jgi:3-hydroxyethyl bacteriochlorophyllide a dehydrogenase